MFMGWLSISCWTLAVLGYKHFCISLEYKPEWPAMTPPIVYTLMWVLSVALGLAVPMLLFWHIYLISRGETSIEGHDNDYFAKKAKERNMVYVNPYDLGSARKNLEFFFNAGPDRFPYYTILLPFRYPPATSGWKFPLHPVALARRREALHSIGVSNEERNKGVVVGDEDEGELTDDEGGGGGFWSEPAGEHWE